MTDKETANAMPVVAHMYGVIVSKNLKYNEKNQKAQYDFKKVQFIHLLTIQYQFSLLFRREYNMLLLKTRLIRLIMALKVVELKRS